MKFWERVRQFANGRVRAAYMRRHCHERRCPNCQVWTSEVDGARDVRDEGDGFEVMQCNQCQAWSRWDYRPGLIVVLAEPWRVETLPVQSKK